MHLPDGFTDIAPGKLVTVVTSLQMLAPPGPRPQPPERGWTLVRHDRPDIGWYRDLYRRIGEDWLWWSRLAMADAALAEIIHARDVAVYALQAGDRAQGLLELDFRTASECELGFFGIVPELIGTGAGRWLMNHAIALAWERPIDRFWVHTCTLDHPHALDFYMRSGFVPCRRQVEVADDPRLDGVLPKGSAAHFPIIEPSNGT